jgi:hypothetical protein
LLLGAFLPLVIVVTLASVIALVVLVREIRMLIGTPGATRSLKRALLKGKYTEAENQSSEASYRRVMQEKGAAKEGETNRVQILERESDNEWLAEIESKLDPTSLEDIELLNTAKTMLRHANYTMGHPSGQFDRLKYSQGQQQKELSKRFIEKKLIELKSAK